MEEIDIRAGKVLRRYRTLRGYSQDELAKAVGITFQQIQKYESAKNRISLSMFFAICSFLRVSPSAFIEAMQGNTEHEAINIDYVKEFIALPVEARKKMLQYYVSVYNDFKEQGHEHRIYT